MNKKYTILICILLWTLIFISCPNLETKKHIGLWEAQAIDNYETIEVRKKNRDNDEKEDWSRISHNDLQKCHSSLSFFDAESMRFHLPTFIIASLHGKTDDPVFYLTQLDDTKKSKLALLNQEQKKAIAMYLEWCLKQEDFKFEHLTFFYLF